MERLRQVVLIVERRAHGVWTATAPEYGLYSAGVSLREVVEELQGMVEAEVGPAVFDVQMRGKD